MTLLAYLKRLLRATQLDRAATEHSSSGSVEAVRQFLSGSGVDHKGRSLKEMLAQDDAWWEDTHDFIQWVFPGVQASEHSSSAPVLQPQDYVLFGQDPLIKQALLDSYLRMLVFLGTHLSAEGVVRESPRPASVPLAPAWMRRPDHNDKRITRMLVCLRLAGLSTEADAMLRFLRERFVGIPSKAESLAHWEATAVTRP